MVLLVIFELSAFDLVGEPLTVCAIDEVLYIGMLINTWLIKL